MIEAVTLLHQHHRTLDPEGRLVATSLDYVIARELLLEPLRESIGLSDSTEATYRNLRGKLKGEFDTTEASKVVGPLTKPTLLKQLGKLVGLGLLLCVSKLLARTRPGGDGRGSLLTSWCSLGSRRFALKRKGA